MEFGEYTRMKTLILDMDETLINSFQINPQAEGIFRDFEIELGDNVKYGVAMRPYLKQTLNHLA